jgi:hypothetical protein
MAEKLQSQPRKRGVRDVIVGILSAAMIMSPAYLAEILMSRLRIEISLAAIVSLGIFLVGVFLLVRLLKD